MTWPTAADHIDTPDDRHRCTLLSQTAIRCHDCKQTLVIPLRTDLAPTPVPPPFVSTGEPGDYAAGAAKARAALAALKQGRA